MLIVSLAASSSTVTSASGLATVGASLTGLTVTVMVAVSAPEERTPVSPSSSAV